MNYNILVADDDKEILNAIDIYLSNEGMNIFKAADGMEALKIIEREKERIDFCLYSSG